MIIPKSLEIASGVHLIAVSDDLTTISITYPRGFRSDIPRIGGSAHLFEHLLLAPTREHDPYDTLEYLGFLLSAQTRRDYTTVSATGPSEHAIPAIRSVMNTVSDLHRSDDQLQSQVSVVKAEVYEKGAMSENSDPYWVGVLKQTFSSWKDAHDPYLSPEHLERLSIDHWNRLATDHFNLSSAAITVVSGLDPSVVLTTLGTDTIPAAQGPGLDDSVNESIEDAAKVPGRSDLFAAVLVDPQGSVEMWESLIAGRILALHQGLQMEYGIFNEVGLESSPTHLTFVAAEPIDWSTFRQAFSYGPGDDNFLRLYDRARTGLIVEQRQFWSKPHRRAGHFGWLRLAEKRSKSQRMVESLLDTSPVEVFHAMRHIQSGRLIGREECLGI